MARNRQFYQRLSLPQEFEETLEKFQQLIAADNLILSRIKEVDRRRGIFSPAVRYLIERYVTSNWEPFINAQKAKLAQKQQNAQT